MDCPSSPGQSGNPRSVSEHAPILEPQFEEERHVTISDEECIRVRTDVWLRIGADVPIRFQTRKLCRDGVVLEYTGRIAVCSVDVIFPDGGNPMLAGNGHISGTVFYRWPDGVWIGFDRTLRSVSERLMRNSLALPPAGATRVAQASAEPQTWGDRAGYCNR
jgi:hypothetical protein